ncbi:PE family protein, partial [Mycobacterium sp.]|uniref:PE family protein n=1 Tax=Mycobacterium sp. TaxID=1785 RepID=UPI003C7252D4
MSFVIAVPDLMADAATNLASIGSTIGAANAAAAAPTEAVLAAGADEVSVAVAAVFGAHAQSYQALSAQAAAFHDQFVQALAAGAGSYAATEAASASPIQALLNLVNAPFLGLLGRPLIGNGAGGGAGTGAAGGAGGLLFGDGG